MGKWAKYKKRYCKDWEREVTLKDWISNVPDDDSKAYCKPCNCEIRAHHTDLISHAATDKHQRNTALFSIHTEKDSFWNPYRKQDYYIESLKSDMEDDAQLPQSDNLSEQNAQLIKHYVSKILNFLRDDNDSHDGTKQKANNQKKVFQLEVPSNTKELLIFAISQDENVELVTCKEKDGVAELVMDGIVISSLDSPVEVKTNSRFILGAEEIAVSDATSASKKTANAKSYQSPAKSAATAQPETLVKYRQFSTTKPPVQKNQSNEKPIASLITSEIDLKLPGDVRKRSRLELDDAENIDTGKLSAAKKPCLDLSEMSDEDEDEDLSGGTEEIISDAGVKYDIEEMGIENFMSSPDYSLPSSPDGEDIHRDLQSGFRKYSVDSDDEMDIDSSNSEFDDEIESTYDSDSFYDSEDSLSYLKDVTAPEESLMIQDSPTLQKKVVPDKLPQVKKPLPKKMDKPGRDLKNSCLKCKASFLTVTALKNHKCPEDKNNQLMCKVCNQFFQTANMLLEHFKGHQPEFSCKTCKATFKNEEMLRKHQQDTGHVDYYLCVKVNNKATLPPETSSPKVSSKPVMSKLEAESSPSPEGVPCGDCGEVLCECSLDELASNQKSDDWSDDEDNDLSFSDASNNSEDDEDLEDFVGMGDCGKALMGKMAAEDGGADTKEDESKNCDISCCDCGRSFLTMRAMKIHRVLTHNNFRCKKCRAVFSTIGELNGHEGSQCENGGSCEHCGKSFGSGTELTEHLASHQSEKTFQCGTCEQKFETRKQLSSHEVGHDEKKHLCHLCSKSFKFKFHLNRHIERHGMGEDGGSVLKAQDFNCIICTESFKALSHLRKHYEESHTLPSYHCVACDLRHTTLTQLCVHFRSFHKGRYMEWCKLCGDAFENRSQLKQHQSLHVMGPGVGKGCKSEVEENSGDGTHVQSVDCYLCVHCEQKFTTHTGLISHNQIHYLKPPFPCLFCNDRCALEDELNDHIVEHEKMTELELCSICNIYVASIQMHRRVVHNEQCQCPYCGKYLKTKSSLTNHLYLHTGEKPFSCTECSMSFNNSGKLHQHMMTHSGPGAGFACSTCKRRFLGKSALLLHLYEMVNNPCTQNKFTCEYCDREFTSKSNLSNHLRTHNGEKTSIKKLYSCTTCSRTFSTKAHQIIHTQTHFKKEVVCPVCSKTMRTIHCLQYHMRVHTGEGSPCPICKKYFVTPKAMKCHLTIHTGDRRRFKCPICEGLFTTVRTCVNHLQVAHPEISPGICPKCHDGFPTNETLVEHTASCEGKPKEAGEPDSVLDVAGTEAEGSSVAVGDEETVVPGFIPILVNLQDLEAKMDGSAEGVDGEGNASQNGDGEKEINAGEEGSSEVEGGDDKCEAETGDNLREEDAGEGVVEGTDEMEGNGEVSTVEDGCVPEDGNSPDGVSTEDGTQILTSAVDESVVVQEYLVTDTESVQALRELAGIPADSDLGMHPCIVADNSTDPVTYRISFGY